MDSHRLPRKETLNVSLWGERGKNQRRNKKATKKAIAKDEARANAKIIREISAYRRSVKTFKQKQAAEEKAFIENGTPPKAPSIPWDPGAKHRK
jgi:Flp pilus assembly protein TadB